MRRVGGIHSSTQGVVSTLIPTTGGKTGGIEAMADVGGLREARSRGKGETCGTSHGGGGRRGSSTAVPFRYPGSGDADGPDCRARGAQSARGIHKHEDPYLGNRRSRDRGASRDCRDQGRKSPDCWRSKERGSRNCQSSDHKLQASRSMGHGSADPDAYRCRGRGHRSRVPLGKQYSSPPKRLPRRSPSPSLPAVAEAAATSFLNPAPSTNGRSRCESYEGDAAAGCLHECNPPIIYYWYWRLAHYS